VTEEGAVVGAVGALATDLTTAVRHLPTHPLRMRHFAAHAHIVNWDCRSDVLTRRTTPSSNCF